MNAHASNITEIINRNVVVTLLLKQGYNVFLPVYDDGIDFIIHRLDDNDFVKVQLKSRWTIDRRYSGRDISIAFPHAGNWYLVPHDEMVRLAPNRALQSSAWRDNGAYSSPAPSRETMERLSRFRLRSIDEVVQQTTIADEVSGEDRAANQTVLQRLRDGKRQLSPQPASTVSEIIEMRDEGRRY